MNEITLNSNIINIDYDKSYTWSINVFNGNFKLSSYNGKGSGTIYIFPYPNMGDVNGNIEIIIDNNINHYVKNIEINSSFNDEFNFNKDILYLNKENELIVDCNRNYDLTDEYNDYFNITRNGRIIKFILKKIDEDFDIQFMIKCDSLKMEKYIRLIYFAE